MSVTKEELAARDLVDDWIGKNNIQIDTDGAEYWQLVEKVQGVVKEVDLMKKHADEGWKLANTRTTERQEILKALNSLIKAMKWPDSALIKHFPNAHLVAAREAAEEIAKKYKPLLER